MHLSSKLLSTLSTQHLISYSGDTQRQPQIILKLKWYGSIIVLILALQLLVILMMVHSVLNTKVLNAR
jgi:hypothetical protein